MFEKIFTGFKLAYNHKSLLFDRISSPLQSARITNFMLDLKNIASKEDDTASIICNILECASEFKQKNPDDFKEAFNILSKLLDNYSQNKAEIREQLIEILKD